MIFLIGLLAVIFCAAVVIVAVDRIIDVEEKMRQLHLDARRLATEVENKDRLIRTYERHIRDISERLAEEEKT